MRAPTRSWRRSVADRPLADHRIVVTRPRGQDTSLGSELERRGASVSFVPLVEIRPPVDDRALDEAVERGAYDWVVLTSANAVRALGDRLLRLGNARVAAVGPATAEAVRALGAEPAFVPNTFAGDAIPDGLGVLGGRRVLLPQADIADPGLADRLRGRGAVVDAIVAYRTIAAVPDADGIAALRAADAVLLASGSAARSLAALDLALGDVLVVCIGPKTAAVAREVGLEVGLVADEATSQGMIRALVAHYGESE